MTSLLLLKSMLFANAFQKNKAKKKKKIKMNHKITKINSKMCRICNQERGVVNIFNNFKQPNIPEEIQHFSGVTLTESDNLTNQMCQNCLDLLNGCIMFREMCQKTDKMIRIAIKKEYELECKKDEYNGGEKRDSDDSFNIPSPAFSEDNSHLWSCSTCNKEFNDMLSYNSHLTQCNAQASEVNKNPPAEIIKKKFLCDICGKTAYSNASLLVHMGTHENIFPFKCDQCPYQGRTMDLLKVHSRSHMIDKPYKCTQCPKATTTSSNLAKHMRHVHSTTRPHKCTYCEKAFSYQHDMKRHVKDIHLRQGTVECDVCYKKFNTKKILQGHRWKIHKIKGERQGRLPSYLQCQIGQDENNVSDCDPSY